MVERNEVLVADDEEEIRVAVIAAVREVFPDLTIHEAALGFEALRIIYKTGDRVFLVVSDGKMGGNIGAGEDVTTAAREKGVPHVALYSTGAGILRRRLEPDGIKCITKPNSGEPHDELRAWLASITERPHS